jgi:hypothetical protein
LSYAQEEGIGNEGGEAGVSVELRMPVNPADPVAEKASLPDAAFREAADCDRSAELKRLIKRNCYHLTY